MRQRSSTETTAAGWRAHVLITSAWLLTAVLIALSATFKITCFDVWWHLEAGEYIVQHLRVPTQDIFSYTAQGAHWITHEWLFEVGLYLVHRLAGLNGVILLNVLIVLLGFTFTYFTLRNLRVSVGIGVPLICGAAYLVTFRAFARPHILTEALIALYLLVLLTYKYARELQSRQHLLWLLLPVQLIWANAHSGGVLGCALFFGFVGTELIQGLLARHSDRIADTALPWKRLRFLLLVAGGLLLISLANPNGYHALLYPVTIAGEPIFAGGVKELQSPLGRLFWQTDFFRAFVGLIATGLISFVGTTIWCRQRGLELSHLILFLIAALAAVLALRNLPIFALIAVPLVGRNLQMIVRRFGLTERDWFRVSALVVANLLPAALGATVLSRGVAVTNDLRRPALGYDERIFPVKAADFLDKNPVAGNIFSTMEYNGYFIYRWYPERLVFIDGRLDVYGRRMFEVYGRMLWSAEITDSVFLRYDINCCILPQPPSNLPAMANYLGRQLALRPDWSLIYWDELSLIYVRRIPAHEGLIREHAYQAVIPLLLGLPETAVDPAELRAEIDRALAQDTTCPLKWTLSGVAYTRQNQLADAKRALHEALRYRPGYTEALVALGIVYLREQDYPAARAVLEQVIRTEPDNFVALYNLGVASLKNNQPELAERYLQRLIKVNPELVAGYILLGDAYYQQQRITDAVRNWRAALRLDPGNQAAQSRLQRLMENPPVQRN